MKTWKKNLALLCALCLLTAMFAGCGGGEAETAAASEAGSASSETAEPPEEAAASEKAAAPEPEAAESVASDTEEPAPNDRRQGNRCRIIRCYIFPEHSSPRDGVITFHHPGGRFFKSCMSVLCRTPIQRGVAVPVLYQIGVEICRIAWN